MANAETTYGRMLDELKPDWRKSPTEGAAAVAVAVIVAGEQQIPDTLPEFSKKQIGTASMRLRDNGYLTGWGTKAQLVWDGDIGDGLAWIMLMLVGDGLVETA
jgi:hypothetical protein